MFPQFHQGIVTEAAAHIAGVPEIFLIIVVTEEQRSKGTGTVAGTPGIPSDHEFVTGDLFYLEPVSGAPSRFVEAVLSLSDHPLQAVLDCRAVNGLPINGKVFDQPDILVSIQYTVEQFLPLFQGHSPQVVTV